MIESLDITGTSSTSTLALVMHGAQIPFAAEKCCCTEDGYAVLLNHDAYSSAMPHLQV